MGIISYFFNSVNRLTRHKFTQYNHRHEKVVRIFYDNISTVIDRMRCKIRTKPSGPIVPAQLPSILRTRGYGEIGRRAGFRFQWGNP